MVVIVKRINHTVRFGEFSTSSQIPFMGFLLLLLFFYFACILFHFCFIFAMAFEINLKRNRYFQIEFQIVCLIGENEKN